MGGVYHRYTHVYADHFGEGYTPQPPFSPRKSVYESYLRLRYYIPGIKYCSIRGAFIQVTGKNVTGKEGKDTTHEA